MRSDATHPRVGGGDMLNKHLYTECLRYIAMPIHFLKLCYLPTSSFVDLIFFPFQLCPSKCFFNFVCLCLLKYNTAIPLHFTSLFDCHWA